MDILTCLEKKNSLIDQMALDPILLVDVLYAVCQPQAEENRVDDIEFGESIGGDIIDHATGAFLEALVDFFPAARRHLLKRAISIREMIDKSATQQAEKSLDSIDQSLIDRAVEITLKKLGEQSENSPELLV